ncbi:MAG: DNA-processing protein DprA [Bacillota bacterium]
MEELGFWMALSSVPGLGPRQAKALVDAMGSARAVWEAPERILEAAAGARAARAIIRARDSWNAAGEARRLEQAGVRAVTLVDREYPWLLRQIYDPPLLLYIKGNWLFPGLHVAMVGSPNPTPAGKATAFRLGWELARTGAVVVTGLGWGIDHAAHRGALAAGGLTMAVLASGLDVPRQHGQRLFMSQIARRGALVSEYPCGIPPASWRRTACSRLISGLCHGTVLVDGTIRGPELLTADFALEQGREVLAVPGEPGSPLGEAPRALLAAGATPARSGEQVVESIQAAGWRAI